MRARWLIEVLFAGAAVAVKAVVSAVAGGGVLDLVFVAILLWCASTVLRSVVAATRAASVEGRAARELTATPVGDAARRAVVEERVRLAADIEAVVRASVTAMGERARAAEAHWDDDRICAGFRIRGGTPRSNCAACSGCCGKRPERRLPDRNRRRAEPVGSVAWMSSSAAAPRRRASSSGIRPARRSRPA